MNFWQWWSEQSAFNRMGLSVVGAVIVIAIIAVLAG